jgi:hypothetical protein
MDDSLLLGNRMGLSDIIFVQGEGNEGDVLDEEDGWFQRAPGFKKYGVYIAVGGCLSIPFIRWK